MVGRAGRAGQATLGEAFIIGRGDPQACFGDWKDICQLLVAPVPSLHSQLLSESAFSGADRQPKLTLASAAGAAATTSGAALLTAAGETLADLGSQQGAGIAAGQDRRSKSIATPPAMLQSGSHLLAATGVRPRLSGISQGVERSGPRQQLCGSHGMGITPTTTQSQQQQCHSAPLLANSASHAPPSAHQSTSATRWHAAHQSSTAQSAPSQPNVQSSAVQSGPRQPNAQLSTAPSAVSQPNTQSSTPQSALSQPNLQISSLQHCPEEAPTQQLQRMLLEAIANGSIGSAQDINHLIQSTLLSHQSQYGRVQLATKAALASLRCS